MSQTLAPTVAMLAYPGLAFLCLAGGLAELGATWALVPERGGPVAAARTLAAALRPASARALPPLAAIACLLISLAAAQLAAPFNPVAPGNRNLLVAVVGLSAAAWLTWGWGWRRPNLEPALLVAVQGCWLFAVLAPAVVPENLRPQVLGAMAVPSLLPLKLACGGLYLLCLPVVLQLIPEAAPQGPPGATGRARRSVEQAGFGVVRLLLWLPYCGLFASLFFAPTIDDPVGLLRFFGVSAGAAAIAIAIASNLVRRPPAATHHLYMRLVLPFAGATVLLALLTALVK
jgi:hypothetical protein